jgi:hypothetical protein
MDGNNSQKCSTFAKVDSRHFKSDYYIPDEAIEAFQKPSKPQMGSAAVSSAADEDVSNTYK